MNSDDRDHVKYINEAIFAGYFFNPSDKWGHYNVFNKEFPSKEVLKNLKGIVLPGSRFSVYDQSVEWIPLYKDFLRMLVDEFPHVKIACICFGH